MTLETTEPSDRWLLGAVADNHRTWFRRCSETVHAEVLVIDGGELCLGQEAMLFAGPQPLDGDALMAALRASGARSAGCWSLDGDSMLSASLLARGFSWGWQPHWMARAAVDPPFESRPAGRFAVTVAAPPYATTLPYAPQAPEPPDSIRLGVRLREKVIGSVIVHPHAGVAGLYSMGVVPNVRRRGIGSALVRAAIDTARDTDCDQVVLNATDEGAHCYRACGFRSLGWGQTWWWSEGPAPSAREFALAEAIGFGDLAALSTLAPGPDECRRDLPCAQTPLTLALLTDQVAIGAALLDLDPSLASVRYPARGETLLHLAAQYDRPAFADLAVEHGVDPAIRDTSFNSTALGWAEHFARPRIAARLRDR